jgi:hypothetical protein
MGSFTLSTPSSSLPPPFFPPLLPQSSKKQVNIFIFHITVRNPNIEIKKEIECLKEEIFELTKKTDENKNAVSKYFESLAQSTIDRDKEFYQGLITDYRKEITNSQPLIIEKEKQITEKEKQITEKEKQITENKKQITDLIMRKKTNAKENSIVTGLGKNQYSFFLLLFIYFFLLCSSVS